MAKQDDMDRLKELNDRICSGCGNHICTAGYILCNHCLHGGCSPVTQELRDKIAELEAIISAY